MGSSTLFGDKAPDMVRVSTRSTSAATLVDLQRNSTFEETRVSFNDFLHSILRLRGKHSSRVTDIVELRRYLRHRLARVEERFEERSAQQQILEQLKQLDAKL